MASHAGRASVSLAGFSGLSGVVGGCVWEFGLGDCSCIVLWLFSGHLTDVVSIAGCSLFLWCPFAVVDFLHSLS